MPVRLQRLRDSGATIIEGKCEVCGAPASFGVGLKYRLALLALDAGNKDEAKKHLGKWYCAKHIQAAASSR